MSTYDRNVVGNFMFPKSVAIAGASEDESSTSGRPLRILQQHDYGGDVYVVNPAHQEVAGLRSYPSILDLPVTPDLVLVAVRATHVPQVLRDCTERGVPAAYIISSGFNEAPAGSLGEEATRKLEDVLVGHRPRITGPNAEGIYNIIEDIPLGFSPVMAYDRSLASKPRPGNVAVVAQSGGLGFGIFHQGMARGIGFSYVVTTGNEIDLGLLEYVDFLIEDDHTKVIVAFMEGLDRPLELRDLGLRAARAGKRIVVAKVGRSVEAQWAAVSHTGHMTGPSHLWSALFRDAGIIEVTDMVELLDVVAALAQWPAPTGNRVCIVTGSGGSGVWMTDALRNQQLEVPELEPALQSKLTELLPYYANPRNPVDLTAGAGGGGLPNLERALSIVGTSKEIDVIVAVASLADADRATERAAIYAGVGQQAGKPVLAYTYTAPAPGAVEAFAHAGVPVYTSQSGLARALATLAGDFQPHHRAPSSPAATGPAPFPDATTADQVLHEAAVKAWLAGCGLDLPHSHLARDVEDAVAASERIGYPVVLKVQSVTLPHKGDAGVLALDLRSADDVRAAWTRLEDQALSLVGPDEIAGLLVEEMVPGGFEVLVGVTIDPLLGAYLTVGAGGRNAELFDDVSTMVAPATKAQVRRALQGLRCAKVFDQGRPIPLDVDAFCELAARVSNLAASTPGLKELDLNPVIIGPAGRGVVIVDALAVHTNP